MYVGIHSLCDVSMISVCIATHNGEKYIQQQLISILSQLGEEDEIIISDDGSTDATLEIIRAFHDSRIKICLYTPKKSYKHKYLANYYYATSNFYNALCLSRGEYIFLADQDDIWYPDKVAIIMDCFRKGIKFVSTNFTIIDEHDKMIQKQYYAFNPLEHRCWLQILRDLPFRGCCSAFVREVFENAKPFPETLFLHDCWIGLNAMINREKMAFIMQPLLYYRRHDNNVSDLMSNNSFYFKLSYRVKIVWQVVIHKMLKNRK